MILRFYNVCYIVLCHIRVHHVGYILLSYVPSYCTQRDIQTGRQVDLFRYFYIYLVICLLFTCLCVCFLGCLFVCLVGWLVGWVVLVYVFVHLCSCLLVALFLVSIFCMLRSVFVNVLNLFMWYYLINFSCMFIQIVFGRVQPKPSRTIIIRPPDLRVLVGVYNRAPQDAGVQRKGSMYHYGRHLICIWGPKYILQHYLNPLGSQFVCPPSGVVP